MKALEKKFSFVTGSIKSSELINDKGNIKF